MVMDRMESDPQPRRTFGMLNIPEEREPKTFEEFTADINDANNETKLAGLEEGVRRADPLDGAERKELFGRIETRKRWFSSQKVQENP